MTTTETLSERDEIEMLLPWYVTGRIDAADRARVEGYLEAHPDMLRQLALIREEQGATIAANEAIAAPASLTVARGMDAVARATSLGPRRRASGLWQSVRAFFAMPTAAGVRTAALAAAVVVALQAAVIGAMLSSGGPYTTASGGTAEASTVIVRFTDTATAPAIAAALASRGMTLVDGPKPGGTFVVRIGGKDLAATDRERQIATLRQATDVIAVVLP
jgi:anti-sigma factor RsiW